MYIEIGNIKIGRKSGRKKGCFAFYYIFYPCCYLFLCMFHCWRDKEYSKSFLLLYCTMVWDFFSVETIMFHMNDNQKGVCLLHPSFYVGLLHASSKSSRQSSFVSWDSVFLVSPEPQHSTFMQLQLCCLLETGCIMLSWIITALCKLTLHRHRSL